MGAAVAMFFFRLWRLLSMTPATLETTMARKMMMTISTHFQWVLHLALARQR